MKKEKQYYIKKNQNQDNHSQASLQIYPLILTIKFDTKTALT